MSKTGWTDAEKAGIYFQVMEKVSPIPWNDLVLPEGRTIKAVQMMIQKEKAKVKATKGDTGDDTGDKSLKKKRAADGGNESPKKKGKKSVKKQVDEDDEEKIKPDPEEEF